MVVDIASSHKLPGPEITRQPTKASKYDEEHTSLDVTNDAGSAGLSVYDKKALLINRELDAMGMGRYQWYIWGLCGMGYMLDLLWAQAFGLIASPLMQELGFSRAYLPIANCILTVYRARASNGRADRIIHSCATRKHLYSLLCWIMRWRVCMGILG
jgi:hypothetical protein